MLLVLMTGNGKCLFQSFRNLNSGGFYGLGGETYWWSSTVRGTYGWYRGIVLGYPSVCRRANFRSYGLSVRCVRNLIVFCRSRYRPGLERERIIKFGRQR